jgi:uncharacterized membrane protein
MTVDAWTFGFWTLDPWTLAAVLSMAAATAFTRLAGLAMPAAALRRPRVRAAFEALPAAVLAALIAPTVLATGWAETIAAAITALLALRLPLIAVVAVGVASVATLRAMGL